MLYSRIAGGKKAVSFAVEQQMEFFLRRFLLIMLGGLSLSLG